MPENLYKVESGEVMSFKLNCTIPVFIIYYDSLSCSLCEIGHLYNKSDLYNLADSLRTFEVMTIFAPKKEEYNDVVSELILRNFDFPIYVDTFGEFGKLNPHIPKDKRFHSFLIDKNHKPIYIGNPSYDKRLKDVFLKVLNKV